MPVCRKIPHNGVAKSIMVCDDGAMPLPMRAVRTALRLHFSNLMKKVSRRRGRTGAGSVQVPSRSARRGRLGATLLDTQVIAGDVDSVVEQIIAHREVVGPYGTLMYTGHDWVNISLARRSMELMANEVMPKVNAALGE